jgi:hypothetical protein
MYPVTAIAIHRRVTVHAAPERQNRYTGDGPVKGRGGFLTLAQAGQSGIDEMARHYC